MRIAQVSRTHGQACGIAYFAQNLDAGLRAAGHATELLPDLPAESSADVVVVQHHPDLYDDAELTAYLRSAAGPVVLFAHEPGFERFTGAAGFAIMTPEHRPEVPQPVFTAVHPAWFPARPRSREADRREYGIPADRLVIGSSGFFRFERELPAIAGRLVPVAHERGWFVELLTTPWKAPSPGVVEALTDLVARFHGSFRFNTRYLPADELNLRLAACDLLWSWTSTSSRPYASGALSDQYAAGTRIYACDKRQYDPVLALPNTVRGPAELPAFVDGLIAEAERVDELRRRGETPRHDPAPVSWQTFVAGFVPFLERTRDLTAAR